MATSLQQIRWSNATNALIKAAGAAFNAGIAAVGMVQTADTGQVNWSTTTVTSTAVNQTYGYEIWRFNDTLQATKPVFIKVVYGSTATQNVFGINITVGTGSDGAGNLTGVTQSTVRSGNGPGTGGTVATIPNQPLQPYPAWFSSDGSSLQIAYVPNTSGGTDSGNIFVWIIDRTRNTDGTPNGDGLVYANNVTSRTNGQYLTRCNLLNFTTGNVGGTNIYWPIPYPGNAALSGIDGTTTYFYPFLVGIPKPEAQCMSIVGMHSTDMAYYSTFSIIVNGAAHTYLCLPGVVASMPGSTVELNTGQNNWCQIAMRYE